MSRPAPDVPPAHRVMTPERWRRLEELYHRALELPADRRAALLEEACDDEPTLRREVESLLAYDERAAQYLTERTAGMEAAVKASTAAPPDRIRVALPGRSSKGEPGEFHGLLLQRLRIASWIMTGAFAALMALYLWELYIARQAGVIDKLGGDSFVRFSLITHGVPLGVSAVAALLLLWHPPASIRSLRAVELLLLGTAAAVTLWLMANQEWYALLEKNLERDPPLNVITYRATYVESTALRWFALLVGYGSLIPNTWRRCAAVVGVLAASPIVLLAVLTLWVRPLATGVALNVLSTLTLWIGVATALVVYTSYRIEVLRHRAAEARRLGQYVLKDRLGEGGMGEVYLAEHVLLRRPCAVKLIRPERAGDPRNIRRFEREVRLTATLTHPNTVQIFDYGRAEDDTFYYVMEYLKGLTLDEMVQRHGPLPPARAVYFLRQVCGALQEAHAIGLIHRDIKPGNVRVCERGGQHDVVKLLDFGLVLPVLGGADGERLTQEGSITGTPAYMSPEQAAGRESLDARSDIYSVGALAYFLLTGRPPFVRASPLATLAAHLYEDPAPPSMTRPDIPGDLEALVLRCLARNPADRFPDAEALDAALAACATASPWSAKEAAAWWRAHDDRDTSRAAADAAQN